MEHRKTKDSERTIIDQTAAIINIIKNNPQQISAVTQIRTGNGLSTNSTNNIITGTGTVFLNANLNQLLDVSDNTPAQNDVLTYNGTCWMPLSFDGSGNIVSFDNLTDSPASKTSHANKFLRVNNAETALEYVSPDSLISVYGGEGIHAYAVESNRKQKIVFDSSTFDTTTTSSSDNKLLMRNSSGLNKLIKFNNINLSHLNNSGSCFIRYDSLTGGYGISYNGRGGFNFLTSAVPANNFNTGGICGTLSISHGGTSGTTISEAQTNLQLFPNVDILARNGPSYRGLMYGVNINLMPDVFNLELTYSGQGYDLNDPLLTLRNPADFNDSFSLSVGFFNSGGSIGQIPSVLTGQMSNLHTDGVCIYKLFSPLAGGTSASVRVTPEMQYLTFGPQSNGLSSAIGFRNYYGNMQFKASRTTPGASTWRSIFPLSMTGIAEVNATNFNTNDILIYTGTCFKAYNMGGHGTLTGQAILSLNIPDSFIGAAKLNANGETLTNTELGYLSGITSNVQSQFAGKIGLSPTNIAADGDMIYYDGSGTCWRPLRAPAGGVGMIINKNNLGKPQFQFPGNIFGACGTPPSLTQHRIGYFEPNKPGYRMSFKNIIDTSIRLNDGDLPGASTGLITNGIGKLMLSYTNLTRGTSLATSDIITFQSQASGSNAYISSITKENLAKTLSGEGLSASSGNIRFNYDGVSLPYIRLKNYAVSGVPSASGVSGKLIFVNNGDSGSPCLAVSYNNSWKRIALGANISSS